MKTKPAKTYHRQPIGKETKGIHLQLGKWYMEIGKIVREIWEPDQLPVILRGDQSWSRQEIKNFLKAMEKRRKDEN